MKIVKMNEVPKDGDSIPGEIGRMKNFVALIKGEREMVMGVVHNLIRPISHRHGNPLSLDPQRLRKNFRPQRSSARSI